jgi:hypothetical protein
MVNSAEAVQYSARRVKVNQTDMEIVTRKFQEVTRFMASVLAGRGCVKKNPHRRPSRPLCHYRKVFF